MVPVSHVAGHLQTSELCHDLNGIYYVVYDLNKRLGHIELQRTEQQNQTLIPRSKNEGYLIVRVCRNGGGAQETLRVTDAAL